MAFAAVAFGRPVQDLPVVTIGAIVLAGALAGDVRRRVGGEAAHPVAGSARAHRHRRVPAPDGCPRSCATTTQQPTVPRRYRSGSLMGNPSATHGQDTPYFLPMWRHWTSPIVRMSAQDLNRWLPPREVFPGHPPLRVLFFLWIGPWSRSSSSGSPSCSRVATRGGGSITSRA
jgi:hypothetical protein